MKRATRGALYRSSLYVGLIIAAVLVLPTWARADGKNVLVIFSNGRLLPANVEAERGLRSVSSPEFQGRLYEEFLDAHRFSGPAVEQAAVEYLRAKYRTRPPSVLVAAGPEALAFILAHRAALFPTLPVVHLAVSGSHLRALGPMPADVVGVPIEHDFPSTIEQALRWHPKVRQVVVVTGTSEYDRALEARLRTETVRLASRANFEFLAGVPDVELGRRLRSLAKDSIVFTPGWFISGNGVEMAPRDAARQIVALSAAPVYAPFDTFIGTGVVGGRAAGFFDAGAIAGQLVNRLLQGEAPSSMSLPAAQPTYLHVDWRQLERWGIDIGSEAGGAPKDLILHGRPPGFFEQYAVEAAIALAVFLLQTGLIAGLVVERRRRLRAELDIGKQRSELAHATRLQIGSGLAASIAHELNQPLGAILNNADAAEMILEAGGAARLPELREIIGDIRRADLRASEVIRRLRALLERREVEQRPFGVEDLVRDVEALLRPEAALRKVELDVSLPAGTTTAVGDRIQMQQVLINLLLNAFDASAGLSESRRRASVSLARKPGRAVITVRDHGCGIAAEDLPRLFDSFFTTKPEGMGLGLCISRTLVEAHGGRLWAEGAAEGAAFHVELPTCDAHEGAQSTPVMAASQPA